MVITYDAALRVDTENYHDASGILLDAIDYDYDLDGNRTSKNSLSGGYESYGYEPGFKLASITTQAGTETYGYDGGGRNTNIDRGGVARTLEYDSDDKVTRVVDGGSEVVAYTYDGAGRRVGKVEGGAATRYLVAPNLGDGFETPQAVTDASGAVLAQYVFAGEHPIARIGAGGEVEYYLQDAMGSVIGMADAAGAATATIKYDAFGNVTASSGASAGIPSSVGTDFRYHGMQLDAATGLYHVRARTYDARTGRFTSRDPFEGATTLPETLHPYVFVASNPHTLVDPTGEVFFTLQDLQITAIVVANLATVAANSPFGRSILLNLNRLRTPAQLLADQTGRLAANTHVYVIRVGDQIRYVGITSQNLLVRELQHQSGRVGSVLGAQAVKLEQITVNAVTRLQARALEQYLLETMPQVVRGPLLTPNGPLLNRINSIAQSNPLYQPAMQWASHYFKAVADGFGAIAGLR